MKLYRLKKTIFLKLVAAIVLVLFIIRLINPDVNKSGSERHVDDTAYADSVAATINHENGDEVEPLDSPASEMVEISDSVETAGNYLSYSLPTLDFSFKHRILSVPSYKGCFPDVQDVHYPVAKYHGVRPVANREEAEARKSELLYVGNNPYYKIDPAMSRSIPYLIPRASQLLEHIGRRFLDSLAVKQIPLHTLIVTSVLRTEEDVTRLRRTNGNASEQSCHRFGTTFDISYNRFHVVSPPGEERRAVGNDTLKYILSEVLRDVRSEGRCYIKYEVKQGCFHITVK